MTVFIELPQGAHARRAPSFSFYAAEYGWVMVRRLCRGYVDRERP